MKVICGNVLPRFLCFSLFPRVLYLFSGPKGTLKMLVNGAGGIKLTKDGNVLLHEMVSTVYYFFGAENNQLTRLFF